MERMRQRMTLFWISPIVAVIWATTCLAVHSVDQPYDFTASIQCKQYADNPLYDGGLLKGVDWNMELGISSASIESPAIVLQNLVENTMYSFSCWVKIPGHESSPITARIMSKDYGQCVGTVVAKSDCWSFLKGGFFLDSSYSPLVIWFQSAGDKQLKVLVESSSLKPFTVQQWQMHQSASIRAHRKREAVVHVLDAQGNPLSGASITVKQITKAFPLGSAIAQTIIGNLPYQKWFTERFNVAVFENELKWYVTERESGQLNYTLADEMLRFARSNQIITRGHNIFWEDPAYIPSWTRNLTSVGLEAAVRSRIQDLLCKYSGEFIHWDVSNEMLHFNFYEQRLGPNATLKFFQTAQDADPYATLFMNDYNVIETCEDVNSTVDNYISRLLELKEGGARSQGIGLEGHFTIPNLPLMRAVLDKLAVLDLPIWLTEVDISKNIEPEKQAVYLQGVLREAFAHPSVSGIVLWTALNPSGCYQMCLTDEHLTSLPAGRVVDKLLHEWETEESEDQIREHGVFNFEGFLGKYNVTASYRNQTVSSYMFLSHGIETHHHYVKMQGA